MKVITKVTCNNRYVKNSESGQNEDLLKRTLKLILNYCVSASVLLR